MPNLQTIAHALDEDKLTYEEIEEGLKRLKKGKAADRRA